MKIQFRYFGQIAEKTGKSEEFTDLDLSSLSDAQKWLISTYPDLEKASYKIAVNHSFTSDDTALKDGDELAVLPPFAGG